MSNWYHPVTGGGQIDWWVGLTDRDEDGVYRWLHSGAEMVNTTWWREQEPDGTGDCVSIAGVGGLQDDVCEAHQLPDMPNIRKPLCKLGKLLVCIVGGDGTSVAGLECVNHGPGRVENCVCGEMLGFKDTVLCNETTFCYDKEGTGKCVESCEVFPVLVEDLCNCNSNATCEKEDTCMNATGECVTLDKCKEMIIMNENTTCACIEAMLACQESEYCSVEDTACKPAPAPCPDLPDIAPAEGCACNGSVVCKQDMMCQVGFIGFIEAGIQPQLLSGCCCRTRVYCQT